VDGRVDNVDSEDLSASQLTRSGVPPTHSAQLTDWWRQWLMIIAARNERFAARLSRSAHSTGTCYDSDVTWRLSSARRATNHNSADQHGADGMNRFSLFLCVHAAFYGVINDNNNNNNNYYYYVNISVKRSTRLSVSSVHERLTISSLWIHDSLDAIL